MTSFSLLLLSALIGHCVEAEILNHLLVRPDWKPGSHDHKSDVGIGQCVGSKGNLNMFENSPFDNCNNCDCRKELYNTDPSSPTYIHCITRSCTIRQCESTTKEAYERCDLVNDNCNKTAGLKCFEGPEDHLCGNGFGRCK